jgi:hypothetical protein
MNVDMLDKALFRCIYALWRVEKHGFWYTWEYCFGNQSIKPITFGNTNIAPDEGYSRNASCALGLIWLRIGLTELFSKLVGIKIKIIRTLICLSIFTYRKRNHYNQQNPTKVTDNDKIHTTKSSHGSSSCIDSELNRQQYVKN